MDTTITDRQTDTSGPANANFNANEARSRRLRSSKSTGAGSPRSTGAGSSKSAGSSKRSVRPARSVAREAKSGNRSTSSRSTTARSFKPDIWVDGDLLHITMPLQAPTPSRTGKSEVVASTHGPLETEIDIDGGHVTVNATATITR